jgi:uncharacterized protein YukE
VLYNKEGIMARIRVNTEDLKNKAKDFDSAAEAFKRAGDDILAAAMAMPSYDGQLSGPARKMGYEFQKQARELSAALAGDAESLRKTAQAFEEVDNQTVNILEENTAMISEALLYPGPEGGDDGPIKQGGNLNYLGYFDYGESVIFYKNGEPLIIAVTDENRALIEQYEKAVDDYCKALADIINTIRDLFEGMVDSATIACVLIALFFCGVIAWEIVVAVAWALNVSATQLDKIKTAVESVMTGLGIAQAATNSDIGDILQHMGLDPIDPWKLDEGINSIVKDNEIASKSYNDANNIYDALSPASTPTPSGPTPVRPPTPPSPTPTQTPTPTPSAP